MQDHRSAYRQSTKHGEHMNDRYGPRRRTGLRPRQKMEYTVNTRVQKTQDYEYTVMNSGMEDLEHTSLTQYSVRNRIQIFRDSVAGTVLL